MSNAIMDSLRNWNDGDNALKDHQRVLRNFVNGAAEKAEVKSAEVRNVADAARVAQRAPQGYRRRFTFAQADAAVDALPEGRYALPRNTPDSAGNMITFFEVFEGRKGKRIVQLIADGGHDYAQKTLPVDFQVYAAKHIAEDVKGAMARYGHETNTCGKCGRPLSNDESRAAGIGPKCAKSL